MSTQIEPQVAIDLRINSRLVIAKVSTRTTLLDFLRENLGLIAAKRGCDVQVCGACTVLVDGRPTSSCCMLAFQANGTEVVTAEGLAEDSVTRRLRGELVARGSFQCGFCTPGMVVAATALLREARSVTREEVCAYLSGNLCRCTGYAKIIDAVIAASG